METYYAIRDREHYWTPWLWVKKPTKASGARFYVPREAHAMARFLRKQLNYPNARVVCVRPKARGA